jgi:hypothetical protein
MCVYVPLISHMDFSTLLSCNLVQNRNMMTLYIRILNRIVVCVRFNHMSTSPDHITYMMRRFSELKRAWEEAVVA